MTRSALVDTLVEFGNSKGRITSQVVSLVPYSKRACTARRARLLNRQERLSPRERSDVLGRRARYSRADPSGGMRTVGKSSREAAW